MHICHHRLSSPNPLPCSMFLDFVSHFHELMRDVTVAFLPRKHGSLAGKTKTIECSLDLCINPSFAFSTIFHLTTHPSPFNESPKSLIGCNPICYILHNLTPPPSPKLFSSQFAQISAEFCFCLNFVMAWRSFFDQFLFPRKSNKVLLTLQLFSLLHRH